MGLIRPSSLIFVTPGLLCSAKDFAERVGFKKEFEGSEELPFGHLSRQFKREKNGVD